MTKYCEITVKVKIVSTTRVEKDDPAYEQELLSVVQANLASIEKNLSPIEDVINVAVTAEIE